MVFKDKYKTIYCKNNYYKKLQNDNFDYYGNKWYYNGYLIHREDGPAEEWKCGIKRWYLNGQWYSEEQYKQYNRIINLRNKRKVLDEI